MKLRRLIVMKSRQWNCATNAISETLQKRHV